MASVVAMVFDVGMMLMPEAVAAERLFNISVRIQGAKQQDGGLEPLL